MIVEYRPNAYTQRGKRIADMRCDACGRDFVRVEPDESARYHWCGAECFRAAISAGGLLDEQRRAAQTKRLQESYGPDVTNPYKIPRVRKRAEAKEACAKRAMSNRITCRNRYGADHALLIPSSQERMRSPESQAKRFETLAQRGLMQKSSQEDRAWEAVSQAQPQATRWHMFLGQSIDIVLPGPVFVQIDGVYWHGLNRPIESIMSSGKKVDRVIFNKWVRDRAFDSFCQDHGIRLVRITDKEIDAMSDEQLSRWARSMREDE